jgi:hypothetical protein
MISPALERELRPRHRRRATPNASVLLSKGQLLAVLLILGAIGASSWYRPRLTVTVVVAACMAFYIVTALLKLVITLAGRNYRPPRLRGGGRKAVHRPAGVRGQLWPMAGRPSLRAGAQCRR